jgi:hypothetical protein
VNRRMLMAIEADARAAESPALRSQGRRLWLLAAVGVLAAGLMGAAALAAGGDVALVSGTPSPSDDLGTAPNLQTATPEVAASNCDHALSEEADVDDDGVADRVVHRWADASGASLVVCLATGRTEVLPGVGQAELLHIAPLGADGGLAIVYGATTVSGSGAQVAVWDGGSLHVVRDVDGQPLWLEDGFSGAGPVESDGLWSTYSAWGCQATNDGSTALATVQAEQHEGSTYRVTQRDFQLDQAELTLLREWREDVQIADVDDLLALRPDQCTA